MKVLLVKMSSFGDVLHTLPAIEDAHRAKGLTFDWAIEPPFAAMAKLHPAVDHIVEVPLRGMRKALWVNLQSGEIKKTIHNLRQTAYDLVLDAQGLVKSAIVSRLARGKRVGFDKQSIREPFASRFYHQKIQVDKTLHAVERTRALFAKAFDYDYKSLPLDYGIDLKLLPNVDVPDNAVLFLHGTTWETKHYPVEYWQQLGMMAVNEGYTVLLPWGSDSEKQRAIEIQKSASNIDVLPKMSLLELAGLMTKVLGAIAVDTGLGHLASALAVPCVSLYGPTDPMRTGTHGLNQVHQYSTKSCAPCLKRTCQQKGDFRINPPCFESVNPNVVWPEFKTLLASVAGRRRA